MIGIFDSGVGGLSVWREIDKLLPNESIISFSDQLHAPYGPRPLEEIRAFSEAITKFLLNQGCNLIVVACNTASGASLNYLRAKFPGIPFVGMEPAVKPAAQTTRTGRVGIMATPATFQGELFAGVVERFATNVHLIKQICPGLVEQVEAGALDGPRTEALLRQFLAPMREANVDIIVLGCTHYPFLAPTIKRIMGPEVEVIDPSPAIARQTERVMKECGFINNENKTRLFYTTGEICRFKQILEQLIGFRYGDGTIKSAMWNVSNQAIDGLFQAV